MSLDIFLTDTEGDVIFRSTITRESSSLAGATGVYNHLWHADRIGVDTADQMIEPLTQALDILAKRDDQFIHMNGFVVYTCFCEFIERYLEAATDAPTANVESEI